MKTLCFAIILLMMAFSNVGLADIIWGNTATGGPIQIASFDTITGAKLQEFTLGSGNGRGVVVVNDLIYWTRVNDPVIYVTDSKTGLAAGSNHNDKCQHVDHSLGRDGVLDDRL